MDSKLQVIQANSNLDEVEAKLALDLAEGDVNQALNMVEYVAKPFFTLQIKFQGEHSRKIYGLINFIADGKNGELLNLNVVTTYNREVLNIGIEVSNKAFNQTIEEIKEEGSNSYDTEIRQAFYNKLHSADIFELFTEVKKEKTRNVKAAIEEVLDGIFDKGIKVYVADNLMTKAQIQQLTELTIESNSRDEVEENEQETGLSIYLKCAPIISAVHGTKVEDLQEGDEILVKIVDTREIGAYLANLISTNGKYISTGVITQIYFNEESKRYTLMVEFGPKIYGKLLIDGEVKLALAEELLEEQENDNKPEERLSLNVDSLGPLLVLFLMLIILIIVLLQVI
ncbi:DUF4899 domain-containing protein [Selenihalanaerobacter shriftii]|uniref:Uncharacterized protein n=1 Tax=Selenihalanaerobacter shriftii TaxID=142842 RepID=A0A1T4K7L1_9FIRM|nr:DUF4899 domain-containing protein [Selenihalanaerobacter shriftii]SJZ38303.1 protein of unknown function [Selenihalanaerobacter shriftii]